MLFGSGRDGSTVPAAAGEKYLDSGRYDSYTMVRFFLLGKLVAGGKRESFADYPESHGGGSSEPAVSHGQDVRIWAGGDFPYCVGVIVQVY